MLPYDIHTYWNNNSASDRQRAEQLRAKLQQEFATELASGDIRLHKMWDGPIGPHPILMFEIDFKKPEVFMKVVPFYQLNHGKLSVLIHPRTGDDYKDHTEHAMWLGHKVQLDLESMK